MRKIALLIIITLLLSFWHWFDPVSMKVTRGNSLYKEFKYEEALKFYLQALEKKDLPEINYNIGCALYKLGRFSEAESAFKKFLRQQESFEGYFNLGNVYYQKGLFEKAELYYKKALRLNPSSLKAKINLELTLRRKRRMKPEKKKIPEELKKFLMNREKEVFQKKWKKKSGKRLKKDW